MKDNNRFHMQLNSKHAVATGISNVGLKREKNEDTIYLDQSGQLFLLADGMGGHQRGAQASQTAISWLANLLEAERIKLKSQEVTAVSGVPLPLACYIPVIEEAISETNSLLYSESKKLRLTKKMGTTIVGLSLADGDHILCFHVGDSRVYRWRSSNLKQLTRDHTLHALWVEYGKTAMEPRRNLLTKALGLQKEVLPDIVWDRKEKGDIYLICSDGLTDMVMDDQIEDIVQHGNGSVGKIAGDLVDAAMLGGGLDNISVIVSRLKR